MNSHTLNLSSYSTQGNYTLSKLYLEDHTKLILNLEHIPETYIPLYMKIDWGFGDVQLYDNDLLLSKLNKLNFLQYSSLLNAEYNFEYYPSETSLYKELSAQIFIKYSNGDELKFLIPIQVRTYGFLESLGNISLINSNLLPNEYNTPEYQLKTSVGEYLFELRDTRKKEVINTGDVAALIESYASEGERVPAGIYYVDRTINLQENDTLMLVEGAEIRINHDGIGISIENNDVNIYGGVIDGGEYLTNWVDEGDGTWSHPISRTNKIREMFVGGERRYVSRYPEEGYLKVKTGYVPPIVSGELYEMEFEDSYLSSHLPFNQTDVEMHYWQDWYSNGATCDAITNEGGIVVKCHTVANYYSGFNDPAGSPYEAHHWLQNSPSFLTRGTWCHDRTEEKIIYKPYVNENLNSFVAVIPRSPTLVEIRGSSSNPISNFNIKNVNFQHCLGEFADNEKLWYYDLKSNVAIKAREYVSNLKLDGCTFKHLGGFGLSYGYLWTSGGYMKNCVVEDVASTGMYIGEAWRANEWYEPSPGVFPNYGDRVRFDIENCTFNSCGALYPQARGLQMVALENSTVSKCTFKNMPYIAVFLGGASSTKGCCPNNVITKCEFVDCMQLLRDGGFLYMPGLETEKNNIYDNLFRNNINNEETGNDAFFVYFEAGSRGFDVHDNIFQNTTAYHCINSTKGRGCSFYNNKVELPLEHDVIFHPYYMAYAPDQGESWYDTYTSSTYKTSLTGSTVDLSGGLSSVLHMAARPFSTLYSGKAYEIRLPEGWNAYFLTGNSAGKWFKILERTNSSLTVSTKDNYDSFTLDTAIGDKLVILSTLTVDNEIMTSEEIENAITTWRINRH